MEEKKQEEKQDKPQSLIFGASTIAPIADGLFNTTIPAPATGGLFGTPASTKPPTSIFDVQATIPAESGKELLPPPEKKSIQSAQEFSEASIPSITSFGDLGRNYRVGGGVSPDYLYSKED